MVCFNKKIKVLLGVVILQTATISWAQSQQKVSTLPLEKVWVQIHGESPMQKSAQLQVESFEASKDRASLHWLPRLYLDAKHYQTNEAGSQFFGLLQQRSLENTDFNANDINHPKITWSTRAALGVDWALYEGGMKSAQSSMYTEMSQAQKKASSQLALEQYAQVAQFYGSIGLIQQQKQKISDLLKVIERLTKSYQIGQRSNPVGYSGLLGLKSLSNRLMGLLSQYEAQQNSYHASLKEMGLKEDLWAPQFADVISYVDNKMNYVCSPGVSCEAQLSQSKSLKVKSFEQNAAASEFAAQMEKARYLPRLGAFAESSLFKSERDTSDSYIVGLYLQWNLYNPNELGLSKEAQIKAAANTQQVKALDQQERAERASLLQAIQALKSNLTLLNESQKLMTEQIQVTETLFKNGSVNALQFVEVLSRRADLLTSQSDAGMDLMQKSASLLTKSAWDIAAVNANTK